MKLILTTFFLALSFSFYTQTDTSMHFSTFVCYYNVNATLDTVNKVYIKGRVFESETTFPLSRAVVKIKNIEGKDISSLVNPNGEYALELPKSLRRKKNLIIESSYDGYKTSEISMTKGVKNTLTLNVYLIRGAGTIKSEYLSPKKLKTSN